MHIPNPTEAWSLLVEKSDRKENRTAFVAVLIFELTNAATRAAHGKHGETIAPHHAMCYAVELVRLAEALSRYAVQDCNYGLNAGQERTRDKAATRFRDLAKALGFDARTTGDPRGAVAYLVNPAKPEEGDGFNDGWAVYK